MLLNLGALLFFVVLISVVLYVENRHAKQKANAQSYKNCSKRGDETWGSKTT